jgi:hypothetical protein
VVLTFDRGGQQPDDVYTRQAPYEAISCNGRSS